MSSPRWERLEELFERARALPPGDRTAFLRDACPDDPDLRAEVGALLAGSEGAESFFQALEPALDSWVTRLAGGGAAASETEDRALAGRTVRQYRIEARLGAGGMGRVYRAHDLRLDRQVALKFLSPWLAVDPESRERFLVEARAAAALDHPNVCTVHEVGEAETGEPYIAMALYEGETLKERIARGPLPVEEALELALQIVRGLAAAHAAGIVHRDVKPGNVMLAPGGAVKLLDFGLAKGADASLTRPGLTPGTVAYMSPEQVRGDGVDHRTDLWSLGVVLYEMLAGVRPFRGEGDRALFHSILHEEPPPLRERRPEVPPAVEAVVERLLRKDPAERYTRADDLLSELSAAARGEKAARPLRAIAGWRTRGWRSGRWRARGSLFGALAAVLLAGAILLRAGTGDVSPPAAFSPVSVGDDVSLHAAEGVPSAGRAGIVVLPFLNLSPEPEQEYFSDGITEDLIAHLSRIEGLRVISRTSAMRYKDSGRPLGEIARELGVAHVLEGSVRREGDQVRVVAQLIDAERDAHLWAETYDRELTAVFQIQSEIAQRIADELEGRLPPADRARVAGGGTASVTAYDLLLRGREYLNRPGEADVRKYGPAMRFFRDALEVDARYARAHVGLSHAFREHKGLPLPMRRDSMRIHAERAVELDPGLAEAAAALGWAYLYARDQAGAEREFRRALALDPNEVQALEGLARLRWTEGRFDEAVRRQRRAVGVDPLSARQLGYLGGFLFDLGDLEGAGEAYGRAAALAPDFPAPRFLLAQIHLIRGEEELAEEAMRDLQAAASDHPGARFFLGRFNGQRGRLEAARNELERSARLLEGVEGSLSVQRAYVERRLGREDRAAELLGRAREELAALERAGVHGPRLRLHIQALSGDRDGALETLRDEWRADLGGDLPSGPQVGLYYLDADPLLEGLTDDPRFGAFLREIRTELDSMRALLADEGAW